MIGFCRSSSVNPTAFSMARAGARLAPSVIAPLWRFAGSLIGTPRARRLHSSFQLSSCPLLIHSFACRPTLTSVLVTRNQKLETAFLYVDRRRRSGSASASAAVLTRTGRVHDQRMQAAHSRGHVVR